MQKKSFFKNALYKSILSFVSIVVPLIVGPYIARVLDIELYGIYNTVYSDFQVFLIFASFGVYTYGIREVSKIRDNKEKVAKLFSNLFVFSLIFNSLVGIIYVIYTLFISTGITTTIYLLFLIQIVANIFYTEFVNEALENYKFITIKSTIVKIIYLGSLLLFVKKSSDIVPYALIICLTVFLNNFLSFLYIKKQIKFDFSNLKIKKYIKPLFMIVIISNIDALYGTLDKVMLGKFISGVSVTLYYIPYYLVATVSSIPYAVINVGIPRLAYNYENLGKMEYQKSLNKIVSSLLFMIIPMCLGMLVLAKEIIWIYAGDKYLAAVPIFILACLFRIVISCQSVLTNLILYIHGKEKIIVKNGLIFGILNVILNFLLVLTNNFTTFSAMITTGICLSLLVIVQYKYSRKELKLEEFMFTKQNFTYLILSIIFIPISLIIKSFNLSMIYTIMLVIVICVLEYIIVLYIIKDENLLYFINKIKNKLRSNKK